jgi:hypothetical protein
MNNTDLGLKLRKLIDKYSFDVGILEEAGTRAGLKNSMGSYAGGPVRKGKQDGGSMTVLAMKLARRYSWLKKPFSMSSNKDILEFGNKYIQEIGKQNGVPNKRRLENLMQAVVRNPILRGDYGRNSAATILLKGFDRVMIDTGTFFKNIKARMVQN